MVAEASNFIDNLRALAGVTACGKKDAVPIRFVSVIQGLLPSCTRRTVDIEVSGEDDAQGMSKKKRQMYIKALQDYWRELRVRPQELLKFPAAMRADSACALAALRATGNEAVLEYVHKSLLANKSFLMEAVKERGCALRYAARPLLKDRDVVTEAVRQNKDALKYADEACGGPAHSKPTTTKSMLAGASWKKLSALPVARGTGQYDHSDHSGPSGVAARLCTMPSTASPLISRC
jgi:hypothetical protein